MFFLEKVAKDFYVSAAPTIESMAGIYTRAPKIKVFCFFSSEKKALLNVPPKPRHASPGVVRRRGEP
jgi:hypothetical protein